MIRGLGDVVKPRNGAVLSELGGCGVAGRVGQRRRRWWRRRG